MSPSRGTDFLEAWRLKNTKLSFFFFPLFLLRTLRCSLRSRSRFCYQTDTLEVNTLKKNTQTLNKQKKPFFFFFFYLCLEVDTPIVVPGDIFITHKTLQNAFFSFFFLFFCSCLSIALSCLTLIRWTSGFLCQKRRTPFETSRVTTQVRAPPEGRTTCCTPTAATSRPSRRREKLFPSTVGSSKDYRYAVCWASFFFGGDSFFWRRKDLGNARLLFCFVFMPGTWYAVAVNHAINS